MTKNDLLKKYNDLLDQKGIYELDGITSNSKKSEIENAINCLELPDEKLDEYLIVIKLKYPNTYSEIVQSDYRIHQHNRLFIYNTARNLLDIA